MGPGLSISSRETVYGMTDHPCPKEMDPTVEKGRGKRVMYGKRPGLLH
jgi:hypothetical protein